jgi:hypothetical protein
MSKDGELKDVALAARGAPISQNAACHGCLLIAETSCEMRNLFLDRNLLVPTMANAQACFFGHPNSPKRAATTLKFGFAPLPIRSILTTASPGGSIATSG